MAGGEAQVWLLCRLHYTICAEWNMKKWRRRCKRNAGRQTLLEWTLMATQAQAQPQSAPLSPQRATAALILGWIIPGAGHMLLGKWIRGVLLFVVGDLGGGGLYLLARVAGWGSSAVQIAVADYGTKFIVVAGLLNMIAAVDAHSLANGRKPSA